LSKKIRLRWYVIKFCQMCGQRLTFFEIWPANKKVWPPLVYSKSVILPVSNAFNDTRCQFHQRFTRSYFWRAEPESVKRHSRHQFHQHFFYAFFVRMSFRQLFLRTYVRTYKGKKLPKRHSYEKSVWKTLMKLTPSRQSFYAFGIAQKQRINMLVKSTPRLL